MIYGDRIAQKGMIIIMKKKVIATASILLVLLIGINVISRLDFVLKDNSYVEGDESDDNSLSNSNRPRDLYEPDWETDIFTLSSYLGKNRLIQYGIYNGSGVEFSELLETRFDCFSRGGASLEFMYDYFYNVIHGDHEALNGMFTEDYFDAEDKTPYEAFPMQKIYDIFIRKYDADVPNDYSSNPNITVTHYLVTYKIMENDGLFRYEVDADAELVQVFGILTYADGSSEIYLVMDLPGFSLD